MASAARRRPAGFTLIEMLAVVALFALMAGLVVPNLSAQKNRQLRRQAGLVGAQLELARQRSVVTGVPHRILIDLDTASYRLEWQRGERAEEQTPPPAGGLALLDGVGPARLELSAPAEQPLEFAPFPGVLGRFTRLSDDIFFAGVETPEGWTDRGSTFVSFDRDGTTDYTAIVLEADDGESLTLDVLPLADAVRIRDETL